MCDAPLSRSARRSFAPLQKSRRHNRSYVWVEALFGWFLRVRYSVNFSVNMTWILHPTVPSKTTTLHVHHVFLYISLPSLHDTDVNFTFFGGREQRQRFSFCFSELRYSPLEFNSWKIASIWQIKGAGIKAMKFETARIHFWVTFLPPLPSSLLKFPVFILSLLQ